ncbi:ABC transporter ATP-binding protein [Candidatus Galacturonibacter soehngenii]|uniref:ABC transporter ATP-binding protein n=1 Tax=Candidatus Galacturonatibacter soehngenii TaxID=2307010 RepID=A0A7V7QMI0_9FIRM|nr:ABC transporter ATP-binding protein [Candidatus Galacturonibacter soehngenii]KAB1439917.1 ABC transporter ATP-binding protein [Candidatus Galacturonibacter soehngenii]
MLKLIKYLKKSYLSIIAIVVLLFIQAYCDLSLPGLTSNIVNVGIQQGGIKDATLDKIRATEMNKLYLFMSEEDKSFVESNYELDGELYELKKIDENTRETLNDVFGKPMLIVLTLSGEGEESIAIKNQMGIPENVDLFEALSMLPKEQLDAITSVMLEKIDEMPESIVSQSSIAFVKAEYQGQDVNIQKIQQSYILIAGLKMLGFALLGMFVAIVVTYLSCKVAASFSSDLRENVYKKVISYSSIEMDKFSTASLITRNTNDIQQVQLLMTMVFRIVLYAPILGIGGVLKVLKTNTSMSWIIALAVGIILLVVIILMQIAMPKFKQLQVLIDKLNLVTREILTGIPVIRAFSTQKHEEERFEEANKKLTKTQLFVNRTMTFMLPLMMLIMNAVTILIVYMGAYGIDEGAMQVGDLMAFIQYTMQIIMSFLMLTMVSIMIPRASVSAVRINEVLETDVSIKDPKNPQKDSKDVESKLEFKNVSFAYPDAKENVLSNISFVTQKGETTAIIGSTGSGKSTLVNLIPRFFDVTKGEILVNGINVKDYTQHDLHDKIGYVPQKGVLFSGTIDSNIRYGCEEMSKDKVEKAATIAQAIDFISEKPEKFDSEIAQGGSNVSGGQKQRLSIARAIAKQPEIFIFDDSFSALDYKTDVTLRKALKSETKDAITIIVAQRISTILHADKIIVLDEGKVVGMGTHKELLKTCEVYMQIAMSQLSKEELDHE